MLEDIEIEVTQCPTDELYEKVRYLHFQMFSSGEGLSKNRFFDVMKNPNHYLVTAWGPWEYHILPLDRTLLGIASLIEFSSFSRTALLFEEFIVDYNIRNKGLGKKMDQFIINWAHSHTNATRIEGTVNYKNENTWHVHMKSGFIDRENRTILAVVKTNEPKENNIDSSPNSV